MFPCLCVSMMFQSLIKFKLKSKVVFIVRYNHLPLNDNKKEKEGDSHCKMFCQTIVLSQERTERSRTIPSLGKKNERIERVLKNVGTICKGTERKLLEKNV